MKIQSLENVSYNGKKYAVGGVFEVEPAVAYALGNSVKILADEPKKQVRRKRVRK